MLRVSCRAAVATAEDLAVVEQRVAHQFACRGDALRNLLGCRLLGRDAFREVFANSGYRIHGLSAEGASARFYQQMTTGLNYSVEMRLAANEQWCRRFLR